MRLPFVRGCRITAFALSATVAATAAVALAGWALGRPSLTTLGAGGVAMTPLAAACLLLLAAALIVVLPSGERRAESIAARAIAGLALLAAAARLDTAILLVPTALAVLLIDYEVRGHRPAQWLALAALPATAIVLVGYLFQVPVFYDGGYIPTGLGTAVALVFLQVAVLAGRVEHGLTRVFVAAGAGGVTARRLLPAVVVVPLAIGYLRLLGQRRGLYGAESGTVLFTLVMIALIAALVWWTAWSVHGVDTARAEMELRLQTLIRNVPLGIVVLDLDGRVQLCNDAFVEIFHYPPHELLGRRVDDLIAPDQDGGETAALTQRGFAGESLRRKTVRRRRDGTLVDVELFVVPLEMKGRAIGTYGVYRDISGARGAARGRFPEIA